MWRPMSYVWAGKVLPHWGVGHWKVNMGLAISSSPSDTDGDAPLAEMWLGSVTTTSGRLRQALVLPVTRRHVPRYPCPSPYRTAEGGSYAGTSHRKRQE